MLEKIKRSRRRGKDIFLLNHPIRNQLVGMKRTHAMSESAGSQEDGSIKDGDSSSGKEEPYHGKFTFDLTLVEKKSHPGGDGWSNKKLYCLCQ